MKFLSISLFCNELNKAFNIKLSFKIKTKCNLACRDNDKKNL